jgi:hypothetical protein
VPIVSQPPPPAFVPHSLHDFSRFADYRDQYVIPYLLGDLETIFEGQRRYWRKKRKAGEDDANAPGRGDFFLPLPLFALLDHLGKFLAKPGESLAQHKENIGRAALRVGSTRDIPSILVNLGRNPAVHDVWPETDRPQFAHGGWWGFGFHLSASGDKKDHNRLVVDEHAVRSSLVVVRQAPVLKLYLNLHVLRGELVDAIEGPAFAAIDDAAFDRVRRHTVAMHEAWRAPEARPQAGEEAEVDELAPSERRSVISICTPEHTDVEIRGLRKEAVAMGIWPELFASGRRTTQEKPIWRESPEP